MFPNYSFQWIIPKNKIEYIKDNSQNNKDM